MRRGGRFAGRAATVRHRADLVSILEAGKAIGVKVPTDIVIYAIQVSNPLEYATLPTEEVPRTLPNAVTFIASKEL